MVSFRASLCLTGCRKSGRARSLARASALPDSMAKRPAPEPKVCIFCGRRPLTEEHIWPRWASDLIPNAIGHRRFMLKGRHSTPIMSVERDYNRQGPAKNLSVRRVCGDCNGGWMSDYEQELRPLLTRLFSGDPVFILPASRVRLVEYIAYKLLILDWLDDDPVIPSASAHAFYADRTLPPNLSILAFNCVEGSWRAGYRAHSFAATLVEEWPGHEIPPTARSFAIGFGNFYLFAIISTLANLPLQRKADLTIQLHPATEPGLLIWPPVQPINSKQAESIASSFYRIQQELLRVQ